MAIRRAPGCPLTIIHVGDTPLDVDAGKVAGAVTVGVTYGLSNESRIRMARPDYVIGSFDEMRAFLPAGSERRVG